MQIFIINLETKPELKYFDLSFVSHPNGLCFNVFVHNFLCVAVSNCSHDFFEVTAGLLLVKLRIRLFRNVLEQWFATNVFLYYVHVLLVYVGFVILDYIRMVKFLQN